MLRLHQISLIQRYLSTFGRKEQKVTLISSLDTEDSVFRTLYGTLTRNYILQPQILQIRRSPRRKRSVRKNDERTR